MLEQWQRSYERAKNGAAERENQLDGDLRRLKQLLGQRDAEVSRLTTDNARWTREATEMQTMLQKSEENWTRQITELNTSHDNALRHIRLKHEEELTILESQWKQALFGLRVRIFRVPKSR